MFFVLIKSLCCRGGDARETSAAISLSPPSGVYRCLCFRYAGKDMAHIFLQQTKKAKVFHEMKIIFFSFCGTQDVGRNLGFRSTMNMTSLLKLKVMAGKAKFISTCS
jgi:hypothetical protein